MILINQIGVNLLFDPSKPYSEIVYNYGAYYKHLGWIENSLIMKQNVVYDRNFNSEEEYKNWLNNVYYKHKMSQIAEETGQKKYYDKEMICPQCGKKFIWPGKRQSSFYSKIRNNEITHKQSMTIGRPFCSLSCVSKYTRNLQLKGILKDRTYTKK